MRISPLFVLIIAVLKEVCGDENLRLPKSIIPVHYDLGIVPDLDTGSLVGYVHLNFFVQSATDRIILHGVSLTVIDSSVVVTAIPHLNERESDLDKRERDSYSPLDILHQVTYNSTNEFIVIGFEAHRKLSLPRLSQLHWSP